MNSSRIPRFDGKTIDGMSAWFQAMADCRIIFHPDDPPRTMFVIKTGERMFTDDECAVLDSILKEMFDAFGNRVYDAAYPIFMRAAGRSDAEM